MFKESAVFMMLLIAASIVVTVSVYEPAKVGTQPQIQQPAQMQPQTQKQPLQGSQILGQVKPPAGTGIVTKELQENAQLADRVFPFIVQKLDGWTLARKFDVNTASYIVDKGSHGEKLAALILQKIHENQLRDLVQKMNGELLTQKILPYLELRVDTVKRYGPDHKIDISGPVSKYTSAKASCPPGEILVSGAPSIISGDLESFGPDPDRSDTWWSSASFTIDGELRTTAMCLRAQLGLQGADQQPQEQQPAQPPSPPPGGPPLRPLTP